jgi:hypothetical protein
MATKRVWGEIEEGRKNKGGGGGGDIVAIERFLVATIVWQLNSITMQ